MNEHGTDVTESIALPIPMLARPLDLLCGPPDADLMVPVVARRDPPSVWLAPARNMGINDWYLNPGQPGEPEPLPWKRAKAAQT